MKVDGSRAREIKDIFLKLLCQKHLPMVRYKCFAHIMVQSPALHKHQGRLHLPEPILDEQVLVYQNGLSMIVKGLKFKFKGLFQRLSQSKSFKISFTAGIACTTAGKKLCIYISLIIIYYLNSQCKYGVGKKHPAIIYPLSYTNLLHGANFEQEKTPCIYVS